jgi:hypothetical protein
MQHPRDLHWQALKRILRDLKGTVHYGLQLYYGPFDSILFSPRKLASFICRNSSLRQ